MLPAFLRGRRWFRSRARLIRSSEINEVIPFPKSQSYLLLVRVEYVEGEPEVYTLPLAVAQGDPADKQFVIAAPAGAGRIARSAFQRAAASRILR